MVSTLRVQRVIRELTQSELATLSGVPQWRLSLLERDLKVAKDNERQRLAAALNANPVDLFAETELKN